MEGGGERGPSVLRHAPPELEHATIGRTRLIEALRGRFDRRLTVLVAGAGFGKTTLLAQVVHENQFERWGTDAWLRAEPVDGDADLLLGALARSLTGADTKRPLTVDDLADEVWAKAPTHVALIIDDAHRIEGSTAWEAIAELLDRLPTNGHLVLSSRTVPSVGIARLQLADEVVVVDEDAMAFTPEELVRFGEARNLGSDIVESLPAWPALAVLQSTVGHVASTAFVWEEVLAHLEPERARLLSTVASFSSIDDTLLDAIAPDAGHRAEELVAGLPLVQPDGDGSFRFHSLIAEELTRRAVDADRAAVLSTAARHLLDRGHDRRAAEAASLAGDDALLREAVCRFFLRPIHAIAMPEVVALQQLLSYELRSAPIGAFLDAARHLGASWDDATVRFERAARLARDEEDREVEALATWRLTQLHYLEDHGRLHLGRSAMRLAELGVPMARSNVAFVRSVEAQDGGDLDGAVAALELLDTCDEDQRRGVLRTRQIDLGQLESIPISLEELLSSSQMDMFAAQALWLRGHLTPDVAWSVARTFPGMVGRRGILHEEVSLAAIVAIIGLAAGADEEAAQLIGRTVASRDLVGTHIRILLEGADVLLALSQEGEDTALARLAAILDAVPVGKWPARGHLYILSALRGLVPDRTQQLDDVSLGPALQVAVAGGRALAELRAAGDQRGAATLPWRDLAALRCCIHPALLTELALGAVAGGELQALDALEAVPHLRRWLVRIADPSHPNHPASMVRDAARERLASMPARPPYDLAIEALGTLRVTRSDGGDVDPTRINRSRVRQILGLLIVRGRINRSELAASMWPDLSSEAAAANLRVNLRHLGAALQPDRSSGDPPWFVQSDGTTVWMVEEGVEVDVHVVDQHLDRAMEYEAAGQPSQALHHLRAACERFEGELLPGIDDPIIDLERLRLSALSVAARSRIGELTLARGEPEAAMHDAAAALRADPVNERAARLLVRCHLAVGSTTTARRYARGFLDVIAAAGLEPEAETASLVARIQA